MKNMVRKQIRLKSRDYASEGLYYVTFCTEGRQYLLGHKEGDGIKLSGIGRVAQASWERIGTMYDGITLDEYSIMPNHIHGIIVYRKTIQDSARTPLERVIRNFKSFTTHEYYKDKFRLTSNLWERGYYERVIRFNELDVFREYIRNNPIDWENSRFFELERAYLDSIKQKD